MKRFALVLEGGGFRNAVMPYILMMVRDVARRCGVSLSQFTVYCVSSAAPMGIAFATNTLEQTESVWVDRLSSWRVYSVRNTFHPFVLRPGNIRYLIDECCNPLNPELIEESGTTVKVVVLNYSHAQVEYIVATQQNVRQLLKATCALPYVAGSVTIDGYKYFDGGLVDPLPIHAALVDGFSDVIVVGNRPPGFMIPKFRPLTVNAMLPHDYRLRFLTHQGPYAYQDALNVLDDPPSGINLCVIRPQRALPCDRFKRTKRLLQQTVDVGRQLAEQYNKDVLHFFQEALKQKAA